MPKKEEQSKVFKLEEFESDDSFLSWLWFKDELLEEKEPQKEEDIFEIKKETYPKKESNFSNEKTKTDSQTKRPSFNSAEKKEGYKGFASFKQPFKEPFKQSERKVFPKKVPPQTTNTFQSQSTQTTNENTNTWNKTESTITKTSTRSPNTQTTSTYKKPWTTNTSSHSSYHKPSGTQSTYKKPWSTNTSSNSSYNKPWGNRSTFNKTTFNRTWNQQVTKKPENKTEVKVKKEYKPQTSSTLKQKLEIKIWDSITVKEFSEKMWFSLSEVMKKLLMNKIIVSANSSIDFETANLIWEEFGVKVEKDNISVSVEDILSGNLQSIIQQDKEAENTEVRPPIVTIMWHVDHWKTKLLDYIRKTNVVSGEAGWITQSIWASQATHNWKKITFVDTPWHELFTSLRARGSKITDIVVIVIAADDGIKPQTVEAIAHAKDSGVPIIVAATKIDKPNINLEMIKSQMTEHGLVPEEWGWDIPIIPLSGVTWEWVADLLDIILLQAEMLELKYNPDRMWVWVILEAHKDLRKWVVTSMILMTGSLKIWDIVFVHNTYGKVKKMVDWVGKDIALVKWWDPVMILWIQELPEPGRIVEVMKSEKDANIKLSLVKDKDKNFTQKSSMQSLLEKINAWEKTQLKLILKSDSFGSLEALKYSIEKIEMPENIEIKVIHADLGDITDWDIILADASGAIVIWFNIWYNANLKKKAEQKNIHIKNFDIIYEIVDYVDSLAKWLIKVEEKEVEIGKLLILWVFFKKGNEMIIWWQVSEWKALNGAAFRTRRWDEIIGTWRITSLRKGDENVNELWAGHQCWMRVKSGKKIEENDILELYVIE